MNKEDKAAATLRMRVREIQLLGGRTDGNSPNSNAASSSHSSTANSNSNSHSAITADTEEPADDLPF